MPAMRLTFLGTGTSTGVPQIGCNCEVCRSSDAHNKRLRTAAFLEINGYNILIDCGPDFRQQILRIGSPDIDALLVTHSHYDHLGGIDDLRPYCYRPGGFSIYCRDDVMHDIHVKMPYCFGANYYPGAPKFNIHTIDDNPFCIGPGVAITPLPVMHTQSLCITGFRIGGLSYITDCKSMPQATLERLKGSDTLVINALRHDPHPSHMNLTDALHIIDEVRPRQAYLTHISHQLGLHATIEARLPQGAHLAYDGLTIDVD